MKAQALTHLNEFSEARRCLNEMYQLDKKNTPDIIAVLNPKLKAVFVADDDDIPPIKVFLSESIKERGRAAILDALALAVWSYLGETDASFPDKNWRNFVSRQDLSAPDQDGKELTQVLSFLQEFIQNSKDERTSAPNSEFLRAVGSEDANEYFFQGLALSGQGEHSDAADAFKMALDCSTPLRVTHEVALHHWLTALYNADRYKEMEEATAHTMPSDPEMRLYHGMAVLTGRRDPHEAERDFQAVLAAKPDDADVAHGIGLAWMKHGDEGKAEKQFRRALVLRPEFPAAFFNLALTCKQQGKTEEARMIMQKFLNAEPSGPFAKQARHFLREP